MPEIEVSGTVFARLQALAVPLVDTPESVITRLLDAHENATSGEPTSSGLFLRRVRQRATVGEILPESDYWVPILQALVEAGGSAPAVQVIDRVGEILDDRLTTEDRGELKTGGTRWKKRTQFARFNMVRDGLLERESPRGIWAISDDGRAYLAAATGSERQGAV